MKRHAIILLFALVSVFLWHIFSERPLTVKPTILSCRIGQPFSDVVKGSTYPVMQRSNVPTDAYLQAGETFVTEPAVHLRFNDPKHGFTLPATKFAMVSYIDDKVSTIATSPMLEKLPFDQAVKVLEDLQNQFKASGWEPWQNDGSRWFDLTLDGKKQLYARMLQPGFSHEVTLRIPKKYGMTLRIWCAEGCVAQRPPYLFLIDVGIGRDVFAEIKFSQEAK